MWNGKESFCFSFDSIWQKCETDKTKWNIFNLAPRAPGKWEENGKINSLYIFLFFEFRYHFIFIKIEKIERKRIPFFSPLQNWNDWWHVIQMYTGSSWTFLLFFFHCLCCVLYVCVRILYFYNIYFLINIIWVSPIFQLFISILLDERCFLYIFRMLILLFRRLWYAVTKWYYLYNDYAITRMSICMFIVCLYAFYYRQRIKATKIQRRGKRRTVTTILFCCFLYFHCFFAVFFIFFF